MIYLESFFYLQQIDEIQLKVADDLSPNNYHNNAFRRSFAFKHATKCLYIRRERMTSVGDYVMIIIHCLAHVSVGSIEDDSEPLFLRAFYKVGFL